MLQGTWNWNHFLPLLVMTLVLQSYQWFFFSNLTLHQFQGFLLGYFFRQCCLFKGLHLLGTLGTLVGRPSFAWSTLESEYPRTSCTRLWSLPGSFWPTYCSAKVWSLRVYSSASRNSIPSRNFQLGVEISTRNFSSQKTGWKFQLVFWSWNSESKILAWERSWNSELKFWAEILSWNFRVEILSRN